MSSKPETTFTNGVHKFLPPGRRDPYYMKNHNEYIAGVFDCWYSGSAGDLWVEYKYLELPKRDTTLITPSLSPLQLEWGRERHDEGRNVAVVVGCEYGGVIFTSRAWENEITTADFKRFIKSRKEIAEWIKLRTSP